MTQPPFDLEQNKKDLKSDRAEVRTRAVAALLYQAKQDASIHSAALEIFRGLLASAADYWTLSNAARGIELIAGVEEGRRVWSMLLNHPVAKVVADVASTMKDPFYFPVLLEIFERRRETVVQIAVMHKLSRIKLHEAFSAIVARLAAAELRPHAIVALEELGDARAIPFLEPYLKDKTDAWQEDNHGPMMRVCDLAKGAIARLGRGS